MTASQTTTSKRAAGKAVGRLFLLDIAAGHVLSINPDGSGKKVLASDVPLPDGIVVDVEAGHIYWTNMVVPSKNNGYIERADLDGANRKTIVPPGVTFTPKQLHLEKASGKLYWSDREGMRVMRANLDGGQVLSVNPDGSGKKLLASGAPLPDGIVVDVEAGHLYWTNMGSSPKNNDGFIERADLDGANRKTIVPPGVTFTPKQLHLEKASGKL